MADKLTNNLKNCNAIAKQLQYFLSKKNIQLNDYLLKFPLEWKIGYLISFLDTKGVTIVVTKLGYILYVKIGMTDRLIENSVSPKEADNILDVYLDASIASIKYLENPF